jgi:hypothetical protein
MVKRKWLHRESLFAMRCDAIRCGVMDGWVVWRAAVRVNYASGSSSLCSRCVDVSRNFAFDSQTRELRVRATCAWAKGKVGGGRVCG